MASESKEQVVNIVPQSLNWHRELVKGTRLGNASNQVTSHSPDQGSGSYTAGQALSWNIPISAGNLTASDPEISFQYVITLSDSGSTIKTSTAVAVDAVQHLVGLHSVPNNRLIDSCTVKLNGQVNMSSNPATDASAIIYNMNQSELKRIGACSTPDNLYTYSATANYNVLRNQSDSLCWGRGLGSTVVNSMAYGSNDIVITLTHTEKLMARPFQWHEKEPSAFVGINNLSINMNLASNFANAAVAANSLSVDTVVVQNAQIRLGQFAPHVNMQKQIPTRCYWNTPVIEHTVTASKAVAQNASIQFNSTSRSYSTVPKLYCVYAYAARTATTPERLYPITNLSVNSGIKKNLLKSYSQHDLYDLSVKNGYNGTASQFFGGYAPGTSTTGVGTGCMVFFTPSDLDSELFHQSNVETNHVFNVDATVTNLDSASATVFLRVVTFSDAVLAYDNGNFNDEMASIHQSELAGARDTYMNTIFENNQVLGGSVWSWIKKAVRSPVFKSIVHGLRNSIPVVKDYVGDSTAIGKLAKSKGYGKRRASKKGSGVISLAGAKLTKAQLMSLLN